MSWEWDERYANWLPEPLAEQIKGHEFERFRRLTQALQGVAESIPDSEHIRSDPAAFLRLGPWLDHVNRCDLRGDALSSRKALTSFAVTATFRLQPTWP